MAAAILLEEELAFARRYGGKPPAPPPRPQPQAAVYHAGRGQYVPQKAYAYNGKPRRCRAGSGAPSYSSRAKPPPSVAPPVAGGLLPVALPSSSAFGEALDEASLPVRADSSRGTHGIEWLRPIESVDAAVLLPLLLSGLLEDSAHRRFVAVQTSLELITARALSLLPAAAEMAAALRCALATRQPQVVAAALTILLALLRSHARVGEALRPHFKQLLPTLAPLVLRGQASLGDEGEGTRGRVNVADLAVEALELMEARGGCGAGEQIKAVVPTFHKTSEPQSRGFRQPLFRNGDVVTVAQGVAHHEASGGSVRVTRGRGFGRCVLCGVKGSIGELINLNCHARPRIDAAFTNIARP